MPGSRVHSSRHFRSRAEGDFIALSRETVDLHHCVESVGGSRGQVGDPMGPGCGHRQKFKAILEQPEDKKRSFKLKLHD